MCTKSEDEKDGSQQPACYWCAVEAAADCVRMSWGMQTSMHSSMCIDRVHGLQQPIKLEAGLEQGTMSVETHTCVDLWNSACSPEHSQRTYMRCAPPCMLQSSMVSKSVAMTAQETKHGISLFTN